MRGQKIAYRRVSTALQSTERQLEGTVFDKEFEDKLSGKNTNRPELMRMIEYAREHDHVYVHSLDRLARSVIDLKQIVNTLITKGVSISFIKEGLTFAPNDHNPNSNLILSVLGAIAEFEREILLERQREGIAIAKAKGKFKGGQPKLTKAQVIELKERISRKEPKARIAKSLKITRKTLYNYLERLKQPELLKNEQA
jgi:DNA invertase Pin-like site-specific DNA recombinase